MSYQSRLQWRCRRGIKEMDLLLERYLAEFYPALSKSEQTVFESLLNETDLDIYDWILGRSTPENPGYQPIIKQLQSFSTT